MRAFFFPRLAWTGIRKNKKLYIPFLLSCMIMVMMFYIMHALSYSPVVRQMRGGSNMAFILGLGQFVIAVFALIFLFYTNSFLIRRRYREFGLYNILGMDKRSISRVVFWETLISAVISIAAGLILGIALLKFAEMGLINAIRKDVDYEFSVSFEAIGYTGLLFAVIFFLLLLRTLRQIAKSKPMELLHSEHSGEKPPKSNWLLALLGIILLSISYFLAVSIQEPLTALVVFLGAVILVIIATYLLFISGSVTLCRLLQKNKKYYYKSRHFISVSSMAFRMNRNGAGLASICILSTMVLVIISSSSSLFFGVDEMLETRYPEKNMFNAVVHELDRFTDENTAALRKQYEDVFDDYGISPTEVSDYCYAEFTAQGLRNNSVSTDAATVDLNEIHILYFMRDTDFNKLSGENIHVAPGQALSYAINCTFEDSHLSFGGLELEIAGRLQSKPPIEHLNTTNQATILFVISDYAQLRPLEAIQDEEGYPILYLNYYFGYDLDADDETILAVHQEIQNVFLNDTVFADSDGSHSYFDSCTLRDADDFYVSYGGLFFLGIMLSIVFCFATVLIMYYKQICEGYEDQARFEIMQKVGMQKKDIKKSINSQILTVFFAPLLFAGLHLAFAYPLIWKILQMFGLKELKTVVIITICAFVIFALLYAVVYKATAGAYYAIVSKKEHGE